MVVEHLTPGTEEWTYLAAEHMQRYQFAIPYVRDRVVLDAACGCGFGSYLLASHGATRVTGVDLNDAALKYAQGAYTHHNLRFEKQDLMSYEPTEKADVIVSFETYEHLADSFKFVSRLHSWLKPGASLLISAPNTLKFQRAAVPIINAYHVSEPTYQEFKTSLLTHFEIIHEWEQSIWPPVIPSTLPGGWKGMVKRLAARILSRTAAYQLPCTQILPLIPERRALCQQFVFLARAR